MNSSCSHQAISLEFFPPRDAAGVEKLADSALQLQGLNPAYVSVTFGAGGSTRSGTADTVTRLQALGFSAAPHLSCVGSTRADLAAILDSYKAMGVRRIVALRGDMPSWRLFGNTAATGFILKWLPTRKRIRRQPVPKPTLTILCKRLTQGRTAP
jgi:5,10-methylenetetrahydrofolate reductase